MHWQEESPDFYRLAHDHEIYATLQLSLQDVNTPFQMRTYDFYQAHIETSEYRYSFKCVFRHGYFHGCEFMEGGSQDPIGEYHDYFLTLPGRPKGRMKFLDAGIFDWKRGPRAHHRILAATGGADLVEYDPFEGMNDGMIRILQPHFKDLPESDLILLAGFYLAIDPRRFSRPYDLRK